MLKALKSEISSEVISFPPNSKRVCFQNWNFHRFVNEFAPDAKISNGTDYLQHVLCVEKQKPKKTASLKFYDSNSLGSYVICGVFPNKHQTWDIKHVTVNPFHTPRI